MVHRTTDSPDNTLRDLHHHTRRLLTTGQQDLWSCRTEWVFCAHADEGRLQGEEPAFLTRTKAQKGGEASATEPMALLGNCWAPPTPGSLILWRRSTAARVNSYSDSGAERGANAVQVKAGCTGRCLQPIPRSKPKEQTGAPAQ